MNRLSLAHLTVIDAGPLELVEAAAAGGFNSIGLRIVPPNPSDEIVPVVGDEKMIRRIEQALADTGLNLLDMEAIWLSPRTSVHNLIGALETGARLGAKYVLVVGNDPERARTTDNFGLLCREASKFGLSVMLEFIPYCQIATLDQACQLVHGSGETNVGVLIDALHLSRSGAQPEDVKKVESRLLAYCQLCDAKAERPQPAELRTEARTGRFYPGQGALWLSEFLDHLPAGIPFSIEAPCLEYAPLPARERGKLCGEATRNFLTKFYGSQKVHRELD
jgi:sugar phosphate isomerase/epimerase